MIKPRLKNIHCPCRDNSIPQPVELHSSQTLLANLNFPTSKRYLFLNSLKLCPLLTPSPTTWKNLSGSKFSKKAWRHLPNNADVFGLGLPSDNNFQPITSFVSLELLGNEIVVGVTLLGYGRKHVTCCLRELNKYCKVVGSQGHIFLRNVRGCYKHRLFPR